MIPFAMINVEPSLTGHSEDYPKQKYIIHFMDKERKADDNRFDW